MLVLSRKQNQTIIIGNIEIRVIAIRASTVRLGISAPAECSIRRGELPVERIVEVSVPS